MLWRRKYTVSLETLRALYTLEKHPGINASTFAGLVWPHLHRGTGRVRAGRMVPVLKAAQYLRQLKNMNLVRIKYSNNIFKAPAHCVYYLSDTGYEICEYYRLNP